MFPNSCNHPRRARPTHHMSICVEYSEEPSSTSGGRYHSVTTSLEYVLVGTDLALARPAERGRGEIKTDEGLSFQSTEIFIMSPDVVGP